ncbi:hypothetical protein K469DRAFT_187263 [Zopfia rhizophila CBS 207.26]|uniref:Uncharacterized protein n=1 Tax=Zopfia rhizophila CBS 207.26 TaxID=1314779 RepID=A0A6A6ESD3_9PEZI|nr:hypothetical protein K469DRAFT_187263 [Zopfia rhizophila CBS 207.26]
MGPCRPIPCYLGEQKTSRGNVRGNTSNNVHTTSTGGKTPLGRAVLTPLYKSVLIPFLPRLPFKPFLPRLCVAFVKPCAYP